MVSEKIKIGAFHLFYCKEDKVKNNQTILMVKGILWL